MRYGQIPDTINFHGLVYRRSAIYPYRTSAGQPWEHEVRRYDLQGSPGATPERMKTYRPYMQRADGLWVNARRGSWPLYHLLEVQAAAPDAPVLIVEGEKCADAAQAALWAVGLPWAVTTTPGGAGQVNSLPAAMFAPLAGRSVVIIPDHDDAGEDYAIAISEHVRQAGAVRVATLRLEGLQNKGDIVDWLALGASEMVGHHGD